MSSIKIKGKPKLNTDGTTTVVLEDNSTHVIKPLDETPEAKALATYRINGGEVEPALTPFENDKSNMKANVVEKTRKARRVLAKNVPLETVIDYLSSGVMASVLGASRAVTDPDIQQTLAPIPQIAEMGFGFEAMFAFKDAENRRMRTITEFSGSFLAARVISGLEQRAKDVVEAATEPAHLQAAEIETDLSIKLAIIAVSMIVTNNATDVAEDIAPIMGQIGTGDLQQAGQALIALELKPAVAQTAQYLQAELEK